MEREKAPMFVKRMSVFCFLAILLATAGCMNADPAGRVSQPDAGRPEGSHAADSAPPEGVLSPSDSAPADMPAPSPVPSGGPDPGDAESDSSSPALLIYDTVTLRYRHRRTGHGAGARIRSDPAWFLAHMDITWMDDRTIGFESWVRIYPEGTNGERRTEWKRGWFTLAMDGTPPEFRTVPVGARRFSYASDPSRLVVETGDAHEVILLEDGRAGTAVGDIYSVDGRTLPDGEPSPADGKKLGTGILLGWIDDRYVVWYQHETNLLLEDRFY